MKIRNENTYTLFFWGGGDSSPEVCVFLSSLGLISCDVRSFSDKKRLLLGRGHNPSEGGGGDIRLAQC